MKPVSRYRIIKNATGNWLIYKDEQYFTSRQTRREARESVRQEQALDLEKAREAEARP